jgi:hypothetical protein
MYIEPYRWQDRVIRPGRWKADLSVIMLPLAAFLAASVC